MPVDNDRRCPVNMLPPAVHRLLFHPLFGSVRCRVLIYFFYCSFFKPLFQKLHRFVPAFLKICRKDGFADFSSYFVVESQQEWYRNIGREFLNNRMNPCTISAIRVGDYQYTLASQQRIVYRNVGNGNIFFDGRFQCQKTLEDGWGQQTGKASG